MIFSVGPMIFACLMLAEPQRRLRRAATLAAIGAVGIAVAAFLLTVLFLGGPNRNSVMAVVQLFDISGVYQQTGSHCIPPALVPSSTTAEQILSRYDPGLVGEIVWSGTNDFRLPGSPAEYASLRQCWTETVRRHPREFLWGKVRYFMIFLMVGVEFAPATDTDVSGNARVGIARPDNVLKAGMQTYVERSRDSLVWKGWFWLLLTGAACVAAGLRNRRQSVPGVALYTAVLGTLIPHALFGTTAVSRFYFLPFLLCVACLIALWPTRGDGAAAKSVSP